MDRHYPTLDLIDRALMDPERALTTASNADALERRARALADAYWSEWVWLTGVVSGPALERVAAELQALRIAPQAAPVPSSIESVIVPIGAEAPRVESAA
jgi:hypothetical protein